MRVTPHRRIWMVEDMETWFDDIEAEWLTNRVNFRATVLGQASGLDDPFRGFYLRLGSRGDVPTQVPVTLEQFETELLNKPVQLHYYL